MIKNSLFLCLLTAAFLIISGSISAQTADTSGLSKRDRIKQSRQLLKKAIKLISRNETDSALIFLDSILVLDVKNPDAYYHKGWILTLNGDTAAAENVVSLGISKAPLSTKLKILAARIKLNRGKVEEAAGLVNSILAIKPRQGEALYLKGVTLLNQNDTANAIEVFQKALDIALVKGKK